MATDRTAIDTIRGYYNQFDLYALQILESCGEEIVQEGIEDVDVKTATETTACLLFERGAGNQGIWYVENMHGLIKYDNECNKI